jgi:hypothetical protein
MEGESNAGLNNKYSKDLEKLEAQKNNTWQTLESEKQKIG